MPLQHCTQSWPSTDTVEARVRVFGIHPLPAAHTCQPPARPPLRPFRRPECLSAHLASSGLQESCQLHRPSRSRRCRACRQRVAAQAEPSPEQPSHQQRLSSWQRMMAFAAVLAAGFLASNRQAHAMARCAPAGAALHHDQALHPAAVSGHDLVFTLASPVGSGWLNTHMLPSTMASHHDSSGSAVGLQGCLLIHEALALQPHIIALLILAGLEAFKATKVRLRDIPVAWWSGILISEQQAVSCWPFPHPPR